MIHIYIQKEKLAKSEDRRCMCSNIKGELEILLNVCLMLNVYCNVRFTIKNV